LASMVSSGVIARYGYNHGMSETSYTLGARPSFWEGIARLWDFGGTLNEYNRALTPEQADFLALRADWRVAARDMGITISEIVKEDLSRTHK